MFDAECGLNVNKHHLIKQVEYVTIWKQMDLVRQSLLMTPPRR